MTAYCDINQIPLFRYGLIMADPPWAFKMDISRVQWKYHQMSGGA